MLNEAALIEKEVTARLLRIDPSVLETRRAMARWLTLALGIINPGETRQSAVAVLDGLLYYQFVKQADPNAEDLMRYVSANWEQMNEKTLRYHLLRLKKMGLVENTQGRFYFRKPRSGDRFNPENVFGDMFESNYKEMTARLAEVIKEFVNKSKIAGEKP
ncbi:MAG: hypothetical protein ACP5T3_01535 [Candidatus Micrarchaeia archaeon]